MAVIHVPRPPKSAYDPSRKASSLLRAQVEHMHVAERRLPERYRTNIYVNAIRTEREVAEYIGLVTKAIAQAHQDTEAKRAKSRAKPGRVVQIAAEADDGPRSKTKSDAAGGKGATVLSKTAVHRSKKKPTSK